MLSVYDNPEAKQPILFISAMQRYSAYMITLKTLYRKHYDTIDIFASTILL